MKCFKKLLDLDRYSLDCPINWTNDQIVNKISNLYLTAVARAC